MLEALGERPDLVVVTATRPHAGALQDIVATVAAVLHPLALVGCAAESVVGTGHEIEETPAISLWAGRVGPLAPVHVSATRLADDTWHFAGWPDRIGFDPRALLLLADPFTFPAEEFLAWLARNDPVSRSSGGTCPGGVDPGGPPWSSASGWSPPVPPGSSSAPGSTSSTVVSQGCRAYGSPLTVTRSDRNVIYEVAGMPAMECMVDQIRSSLDPADIAGIEANGLFVGRLIDEYVERSRAPATSSSARGGGGSHHRSGGGGRPGAAGQHRPLPPAGCGDRRSRVGHPPRGASGRRRPAVHLQRPRDPAVRRRPSRRPHAASDAVGPVPLAGFLAAGEIGPIGGHNFVHAFTASVALFRDR